MNFMNVDTCQFLLNSSSEDFAKGLYQRWNEFFRNSFERVFEEEWSVFDNDDDIIEIESLELNLGTVSEEHFDQEFSEKLREKLQSLKLQLLNTHSYIKCGNSKVNIRRKSKSSLACEHLIYFLLHGCVLPGIDDKFSDVSYLLQIALESSSSSLRAFLERYGHYDFILRRLSQQFSDEDLEKLVDKLHPDESRFVCLYVKLHIEGYKKKFYEIKTPNVSDVAYRDVLWQVVLSYLYTEGKSWFSRKQFIAYTLKALAAHYCLDLSLLVRWVTFAVNEMESFQAYRLEFTELLTKIAEDNPYVSLDNTEANTIISVLQTSVPNVLLKEYLLSRNNLMYVLSQESNLHSIVSALPEDGIRKIIVALSSQEANFIFCLDDCIERIKNKGVLSGKCNNEYSHIKWQFILQIAINMPETRFDRVSFVQTVIKNLADYYHVDFVELLDLFRDSLENQTTSLEVSLSSVLSNLHALYVKDEYVIQENLGTDNLVEKDLERIVQDVTLFEKFFSHHSIAELERLISTLHLADNAFVVHYARNLEKHRDGLLEGKANEGFSCIKWRILFSCLMFPHGSIYSRKIYFLKVLKELAAHYNLSLSEVLKSYWLELNEAGKQSDMESQDLLDVVKTLYIELIQESPSISMSEEETRQMLLLSFGRNNVPSEYQRRLLVYAITSYPQLLSSLWKSDCLSNSEILTLLRENTKTMYLFLKSISDSRITIVLEELKEFYHQLVKCGASTLILQESTKTILSRLIQLTSKSYFSWSVCEMKECLQNVVDLSALKKDLENRMGSNDLNKDKNQVEIREIVREKLEQFRPTNDLKGILEDEVVKQKELWVVENAGLVLLAPYLPRLFQYAGYLNSEGKDFLNDESRIRAIFLLQYIVYGEEREHKEATLFLNRLLVGLKFTCPIPLSCKLTENEIKLSESVLGDIKYQWTKMSHTSNEGFRVSFLQRTANLKCENERTWQMNVDKRAYDVLLETIPWSFRMIKYHWIERLIVVEWNYK